MRTAIMVGIALLAVVGCARTDGNAADRQSSSSAAADNTKKNERDQRSPTLTPGDQGEGPVDLGITQQIRQGVIKDDSLSMAAKNVKIITVGGVVTLRGPVKTSLERRSIGELAQRVDGVKRVDNQLEVAPN